MAGGLVDARTCPPAWLVGSAMPRFVILEHDHPSLHWDLMLECGGVLRTWRLAALPRPGETVAAEAVFDHRPIYLDYEGPIAGNRGRVKRYAGGTYEWITPEASRDDKEWIVMLEGQNIRGRAVLRQAAGKWTFTLN
jgi:hypothetical protein